MGRLAGAGVEQLSPESHHILRVEAGLPAAGAELTEEFTPLEAGLEYAVSGAKGCYTGQEVLARQTTYDKVTQHLVRLRLEAPAGAGERLWAGDKVVGVITSAAVSPRFGPVALGVVKRPHHEPGSELTAGEGGPRQWWVRGCSIRSAKNRIGTNDIHRRVRRVHRDNKQVIGV